MADVSLGNVWYDSRHKNDFCKLTYSCLASVAGAVIQATGRTELEDGLCAGGRLKAQNGLQRVRTILVV